MTRILTRIIKREYGAKIHNAQDDGLQIVLKMMVRDLDLDLVASLKTVALIPKLDKEARAFIAKEYAENMRLGIKKFTKQQIKVLRKKITELKLRGAREDEIAKVIRRDFGVATRRARFIAKQESNLLTAKLKQARYKEAGVDEYYWVSVKGTPEHPVRPLHQELNARSARGETFRFSNPPRSGTKGEKQNPGEPFNCRCVAVPVVKFK